VSGEEVGGLKVVEWAEIYEWWGRVGKDDVHVMVHLKEGVLYDVVVSMETEDEKTYLSISCTGRAEVMDRCFELALDEAEKLLRGAVVTKVEHATYLREERGEK